MASNAPIGVFDSGVGGLTVAREIMRQSPNESIIYFGDTARVPYGSKSKKTIITYSKQIVKFLQRQNVKAIVIACNTVSALALDIVKEELTIPVIGVVEPGAKVATNTTKNGNIGIIGTEATINSGIYNSYIKSINSELKVYGKACPLFVPLVEEGWISDPVTSVVAKRYLDEISQYNIDTLVLGCTHYPLIRHIIGDTVGDKVSLVNPAYETARSLKEVLISNGIESDTKVASHKFFVSDGAMKFQGFANTILPCEVVETKDVDIEKLIDEVNA